MEIDALLEAFQDFEKKTKKETCPVLDQFLCHVAKTGQPVIPWSLFKTYFMFKLEKVMDDFQASAPEQTGKHNPNVDYVPFEEMKERILKIVDGYNGIPFTIQRLCELLTDPKRNYRGTDKFLMGLEKNVMVVSCLYPASENNGASGVNRMNGVMFPGNSSVYTDSRNVNGPGTPKSLNRPKLSGCDLFSTNGLPGCPGSKQPEATAEEVEERRISSDSSPSKEEITANGGIKNKQPEEDSDAESHEVKRLRFDGNDETQKAEEDSCCCKGSESESENPESSKNTCDSESGTPGDTPVSEEHEPSSTQTDPSRRAEDSSERGDVHSLKRDQQPASSEENGEGQPSDRQVSCSSGSPELSAGGSADSTDTATDD